MSRLGFAASALAGLALAALGALAVSEPGERVARKYALLVGVKDYSRSDGLGSLNHTEDDVNDLAALLRDQLHYDRVVVLTQERGNQKREFDPVADNIQDQLKSLLEDCRKGDVVLVGLSGHGVQFPVKGADGKERAEAFFCPMDARPKQRKNLVALSEVYERLAGCPADVKLLLVDACRDEPGKGLGDDFDPASPPSGKGVAALFSCSKGQKSFESEALKHGVFFHYVMEGLKGEAANKQGEVTLNSLADYVTYEVRARVKEEVSPLVRQTPNLVGDVSAVTLATGPSPLDCTGEKGASAAEVRKAQQAWAKYLGRKVEEEDAIAPGVKMKFVLIPPGTFTMGSPKDEKDYIRKTFGKGAAEWANQEKPHEVELTRPYYLGVYDVTQAQYEAVTGKNPSYFKGADLPVEQASWEEANAFAKALTEKARGGLVYRLPSEAEWEYSCRGGRPISLSFGIGDGASLSSRDANFDGNYPYGGAEKGPYLEKTSPVGSYKANAFGLFDMQGNLCQWCADRYGDYPTGSVVDPKGPAEGSNRVNRGGGWIYSSWLCRAADRYTDAPDKRSYALGFRLARVVQK